ncbi:DUF3738 domain-containing protein [Mucilaginibacter sp. UR6-11]|uniref:DUF3738 domain-containing protein n=1 Tax=Mucilaginibacter sp. UR6-11 TaxID=1435644 RepID=UPI001E3956DF|nr:DUF3738 domain-containing protein [Mucilaginibacter sp. UR6-11]MCC8425952.1 TIGR03435 family protein [Mucilaginibacter sp. UR6-11]
MKLKYKLLTGMLSLIVFQAQAQKDTTGFVYRKPLFDFDYAKPVFKLDTQQEANIDRLLRFSVFTGYREGVEPVHREFGFNMATQENREQGTIRQSIYNASIVEMLTHGFETPMQSRILLEVKDPSAYRYLPAYGNKQAWLRKNAYCYELLVPRAAFSVRKVKMIEDDVAQHFNISFGYETRKVKTLVLVRTSGLDKLKPSGSSEPVFGKSGVFRNVGLGYLTQAVEKTGLTPVVDDTGYPGAVDIDLGSVDYSNTQLLRLALSKYDLDLKEDMRELKIFVIKELK